MKSNSRFILAFSKVKIKVLVLKLPQLPGFVLLNPRFGEFKLAAIYKSSSSLDHIIVILSLKHAKTGVVSTVT